MHYKYLKLFNLIDYTIISFGYLNGNFNFGGLLSKNKKLDAKVYVKKKSMRVKVLMLYI